MTYFIYMLRPKGLDVCKIGITENLKNRRHVLQSLSPFALVLERALEVRSQGFAKAYEGHIAAWAEPAAMHGEWFKFSQSLHDLFDEVSPAVDVTGEYTTSPKTVRKYRHKGLDRLQFDIAMMEGNTFAKSTALRDFSGLSDKRFNDAIRANDIPQEWHDFAQGLAATGATQ